MDRSSAYFERPINSLADLHLPAETLDSLLGHIGRLGLEALPGWDAAATAIVEGDKISTFGSTEERVMRLHQYQYDSGNGPCVEALTGEMRYFDGETAHPDREPFAIVAADTGVYSVVAFPLMLNHEVMGSLNFYSGERDALRAGQREEGWLFASQAGVTLANARELLGRGVQVEQLQEGLETRTVIGQAIGLLMAEENITSDEAFQRLVAVSQEANVKLRDIARRYVDLWNDKTRGGSTPH